MMVRDKILFVIALIGLLFIPLHIPNYCEEGDTYSLGNFFFLPYQNKTYEFFIPPPITWGELIIEGNYSFVIWTLDEYNRTMERIEMREMDEGYYKGMGSVAYSEGIWRFNSSNPTNETVSLRVLCFVLSTGIPDGIPDGYCYPIGLFEIIFMLFVLSIVVTWLIIKQRRKNDGNIPDEV